MIWWIYNSLFAVLYALALPKYLFRMWRRGGYRRGFLQRLGIYAAGIPFETGAPRRLWVHAVSVGEVFVALRFMQEIRKRQPGRSFILTTNTSTGHRVAEKELPSGDLLLYTPVDFPPVIHRFLRRFRPAGLLLVECELWPNMIRLTAAAGVPVALLNGRISDSSFRGYRLLGLFMRRVLSEMRLFLVQSEVETARLVALGAHSDRIIVTGSAKYDGVSRDAAAESLLGEALAKCGMGGGRRLLVAGSTWEGEESAMLRIMARLRKRIPGLAMVLVPRHVERADEVDKEVVAAGFRCIRRSAVGPVREPADVLLVDTTGELRHCYPFADAIFVGKSLSQHGGQNIIEAGYSGKPVLVGPHMENFPVIVRDFLAAGALVQVPDEAALLREFAAILDSPTRAEELGRRAKRLVEERRGVVARGVDDLMSLIPEWVRAE